MSSLVAAALVSGVSVLQTTRGLPDDPYNPPRFRAFAWWFTPLERNGFMRLPAIDGELNGVDALADGRHVWAVGNAGFIMRSSDGGLTWQQDSILVVGTTLRQFNPDDTLPQQQVQMKDEEPLARSLPRLSILLPVSFTQASPQNQSQRPARQGARAADSAGSGNASPFAQSLPQRSPYRLTEDLSTVLFVDSLNGWIVARSRTTYVTSDAGRTWQQAAGTWGLSDGVSRSRAAFALPTDSLRSASYTDSIGWGVSYSGVLLRWTAADSSWRPAHERRRLESLFFADASTGWAVGTEGTILRTTDGGSRWVQQASGTDQDLLAVHAQSADRASAVNALGEFLQTRDAGATWTIDSVDSHAFFGSVLQSAAMRDSFSALAVQPEGFRAETHGGARSWELLTPDLRPPPWGTVAGGGGWITLADVAGRVAALDYRTGSAALLPFRDSSLVIAAYPDSTSGDSIVTVLALSGADSVVRFSRGDTVKLDAAATVLRLRVFHFLARNHAMGWAIGADGAIYSTRNGGRTWSLASQHAVWPARWFYLAGLAILGTLFLQLRPRRKEPHEGVADLLISDRPIANAALDRLEYARISRALSRFLRNAKTEPPLTVAIAGKWGTGKSSLMSLLQTDLQSYGFRPVWFNAWHHQKEEHLLAALLTTVQLQAVPPWWTPDGWSFRFRLLRIRSRRYAVAVAVLTPLLLLSLGYLLEEWRTHRFTPLEIGRRLVDMVRALPAGTGEGEWLPFFASLATAITALLTWWLGAKPFGGTPASLMASARGATRLKDLKTQAGFRHQFQTEFKEVTQALKPRTLVVIVDDLDRCRPENVVEVLESINFLTSAGDCFVVIGMDTDFVEGCVGLGFRDVAEELVSEPAAARGERDARAVRREFARQYLEKLVTIEVVLPPATEAQIEDVMVSGAKKATATPQAEFARGQRLRETGRYTATGLAAALVVAILGSSFFLGEWLTRFELRHTPTTTAPAVVRTAAPADSVVGGRNLAAAGAGAPDTRPTMLIHPAPQGKQLVVVAGVLLGALVVLVGVTLFLIRPDPVVHDSSEFEAVLRAWSRPVYQRRRTPRAAKKFVNRVRYFAMRQRRELPQRSWRGRFELWAHGEPLRAGFFGGLGVREPPAADEPSTDPELHETALVSLSSVDECYPEWIRDGGLWVDFARFLDEQARRSSAGVTKQEELEEVLALIARGGNRWQSWESFQTRYETLAASVRRREESTARPAPPRRAPSRRPVDREG